MKVYGTAVVFFDRLNAFRVSSMPTRLSLVMEELGDFLRGRADYDASRGHIIDRFYLKVVSH